MRKNRTIQNRILRAAPLSFTPACSLVLASLVDNSVHVCYDCSDVKNLKEIQLTDLETNETCRRLIIEGKYKW